MHDMAIRRLSEDLAASVQHFVRLDMGADGHIPPNTSAVMQSLTADMALMCNREHIDHFDFEDIMTVMSSPGPLTIDVGAASGPQWARLAARLATARVWPDCGDERPKYSVMAIISSARTTATWLKNGTWQRPCANGLTPISTSSMPRFTTTRWVTGCRWRCWSYRLISSKTPQPSDASQP